MLFNRIIQIVILTFLGMGATAQVTGTVTDANGETIIGASVYIKNTSVGTITDLDGQFSLDVSAGDTLVFSYTGMRSVEIPMMGQRVAAFTPDLGSTCSLRSPPRKN